ncbi:M20 family metallopeptidase [Paenibacillus sp. N1-5-1-14]|uniref:M20 family metallopeptidase n=1 Tax=Paenibacillus radicibacter TaxID=2972488 RepID=UPI0021596B5A|nr:M20 family metallopeptidase [Paenibacillus radicibacter]MCR8641748.1 M20 family metallopeptidase [Paenibacillus radicibacter]
MNLVSQIQCYMTELLEHLEESVNMDSPSADKALNDEMMAWYKHLFIQLTNGTVERVPNDLYGDRLLCKLGEGSKRILIVGHSDTVWLKGEVARRPFSISDNKAYGPGVYDMKAGVLQAMYGMKALMDLGRLPKDKEVILLINSDEEIGSPTSRTWIEEEAKKCSAVLVLEPPMEPGGALKTWRKGSGRFTLTVQGKSAHAGVNPQSGVSAIEEISRQVLSLGAMNDYEVGTTVNVGVIKGGIGSNVVAAEAEALIDVRVKTMEEAERINALIHGLTSVHPEAILTITGGITRPPMERTDAIAELYELAKQVSLTELGEEVQEMGTGGVSDGNFTAACGIPTLDGLGARGDYAHSPLEYVMIDEIPRRAALLAGIVEKL